MPKTTTVKNVKGLQQALRELPKEANAAIRDASQEIANAVASEAQSRARGIGGVAKLVAPTIKSKRDRVPRVDMGGTTKLPTSGTDWTHGRAGARQTVGDVMWGAEFGSHLAQFLPHRGTLGYFLWPTVRDRSDETQQAYQHALDVAMARVP